MPKSRNTTEPPAGKPRVRRARAAEPQTATAMVTDLREWRYRRVLRSMAETFGHPRSQPPCAGPCECWGLPDRQGDADA